MGKQNCHDAKAVCHADAESDKSKHIEASMPNRFGKTNKEWITAPKHNDARKNKRGPVGCENRNAGHERQTQYQAYPKSSSHIKIFSIVFFDCDKLRLKSHAASGATSGSDLHNFGMHRTRVFGVF